MTYAVVQKSLDPQPTTEQLRNAFQGIPGLAAADAAILGRDAFGILVKRFSFENAGRLQTALAAQGVETEVVDESSLPNLPAGKNVNRLDCTPEALMIYDPLNRSFALEWKNIMAIAAGRVLLSEFSQVRTESKVLSYSADSLLGGVRPNYETVVEYNTREARNHRLLLEIILNRAVLRYSITADQAPLLFSYLGDRRTGTAMQNFTLLVQDLTKFAPHAAINRGAYYLREQAAEPFCYPSKNAFYEEITWLLWKIMRAGEAT